MLTFTASEIALGVRNESREKKEHRRVNTIRFQLNLIPHYFYTALSISFSELKFKLILDGKQTQAKSERAQKKPKELQFHFNLKRFSPGEILFSARFHGRGCAEKLAELFAWLSDDIVPSSKQLN